MVRDRSHWLGQHLYRNFGRRVPLSQHSMNGLLEIRFASFIDVHELLRIAVHQWEPSALHLNHDPVPTAKRVEKIVHTVFHFRHLARREWLRFRKTIAKFAAENFSSNQHLKTGKRRLADRRFRVILNFRNWQAIRQNVNQFDDPIRGCPAVDHPIRRRRARGAIDDRAS